MIEKSKYSVIGMMSGTSLDGLDIALCQFDNNNNKWQYSIEKADCFSYSKNWVEILRNAHTFDKKKLEEIHLSYGKELGKMLSIFLDKHNIDRNKINFTASHGHTVFHQPEIRETLQIGSGQCIANIIKRPVIWDFRTEDVKMGGQGAPLVPIGDKHLFTEYDQCLNLGGFSNISYDLAGNRIAYDICPVNFVLNHLCSYAGKEYDKDGEIAQRGTIIPDILKELEALPYYSQKAPKSLGREWVEANIFPLLDRKQHEIPDLLRTFCEHIVLRLSSELKGKVLITGGGALNKWLMLRLKKASVAEIHIPDKLTLEYKEALIFAFLGVLRWRNENNVLSSVTGSPEDHSAGHISYPDS